LIIFQIFKDYKEIGVTVLLCQVRRRSKIMKKNISNSFLLATVYQQLKRMNYTDIAGRENVHVTINDAVLCALKTVGDYLFTSLDI
jgi:hypothetical protein